MSQRALVCTLCPPPPGPKNVRSREGSCCVLDALPGGGCREKDVRRCFGEPRCFVSAQRVIRLKTRLHHLGCARAALRLASITSAPESITPLKNSFSFSNGAYCTPPSAFYAAAGVTGFLFFSSVQHLTGCWQRAEHREPHHRLTKQNIPYLCCHDSRGVCLRDAKRVQV